MMCGSQIFRISYLIYVLILMNHIAVEIQAMTSYENVSRYARQPQITEFEESNDSLEIPEWLQDIPLERKLSKYTKRRFVSVASTLLVAFKFTMPGQYILAIPSTVAFKTGVQFSVPSSLGGRNLGHNHTHFFDQVEKIFTGMGYNGRACLLRTICDVAEIPFDQGLLGEIINFLFSMSTTSNSIDQIEEADPYYIYKKAKRLGESGSDCVASFPNCPMSIFNVVTNILSY